MADIYNINIDQGADYNLSVIYKDSTGTAIDISNTSADLELTTENSRITLSDPTNGQLTITLTNAETALLSDKYFYDLEIESPSGVVTRLIQGYATVNSEVTK